MRYPPAGRAARLAPETVARWTALIAAARPLVRPGRRPCDYAPWEEALAEAAWRVERRRAGDDWRPASELMAFAEDIAQPRWAEPRRDLIEFALGFLEADVMLFRSGYTKRDLISRLRQVALEPSDLARIERLLHGAVEGATGLEEFRALCRLAGHLVAGGHLPGLLPWLDDAARGAILTQRHGYARVWRMFLDAPLGPADRDRVLHADFSRPAWGMVWPEMDRVVPAGSLLDQPAQKRARDAWRMAEAIRRRTGR